MIQTRHNSTQVISYAPTHM